MRIDRPFLIGDWRVEPDRDRIVRGREVKALRPQVMKLLVYLAELHGEVAKSDHLLRDLWADKIVTDATLYNCVAELRRLIDDVDAEQSYVETIPKIGYRLSQAVRAGIRSIAILPFTNLGSNPDSTFLVDGLHEELLSRLGNNRELLVISRRSVERYRGSEQSVTEIAKELDVAAVLDGAVQWAGDEVRVSVQLIDGANGRQLWSGEFPARVSPGKMLAVQTSIIGAISSGLCAEIELPDSQPDPLPRTEDVRAYNAVFLGDQRFSRRNLEGWQQAEIYFRKAIAIDPDYSTAWQRLATSIVVQFGTFDLSIEKLEEAFAAANRAVELDETNGLAWLSRARSMWTLAQARRRPVPRANLLEMYERAIELAPNDADVARGYALFLLEIPGQIEIAIKHLEATVRIDPMIAENHFSLGEAYWSANRFADARRAYSSAHELQPDNPYPIWHIGKTHHSEGNLSEAMRWAVNALDFERDDITGPFLIAALAINMHCFDLAEQWIGTGYDADPDTPIGTSVQGLLAIEKQQFDRLPALADRLLHHSGELRHVFPWSVAHALWVLRDRDMRNGEDQLALSRYERIVPELFDDVVPKEDLWPVVALDIAYLLQATGNERRARYLIDNVRDVLQDRLSLESVDPTDRWLEMEAALLLGDVAAANELLIKLADTEWISEWRFLNTRTTIDSIRGTAEFEKLATNIANTRARERASYAQLKLGISA